MADIDWALVARYAAGECSPEEQARVEHLLAEPSQYSAALAAIDRVAAHSNASVTPERRATLHAALQTKMAGSRRTSRRAFALKIAAAVLLTVGVSIAGYVALHRAGWANAAGDGASDVRTVATTRGQRLSLRLPDGTLVVLAPASTLRIASNYGTRDRALELVGQAAFVVTHDTERPFVVRAGDLIATDLGTEFTMRAYPDDPHAEVVVREGLVGMRASAPGGAVAVTVHPGQRGRLSSTGSPIVQPADTAADFAWTAGRLVFRQTPLSEAAAQLERLYGIDLDIASPDLATKTVNGTVVEARPASQAVDMIATVLRLEAVETGPGRFILRAR